MPAFTSRWYDTNRQSFRETPKERTVVSTIIQRKSKFLNTKSKDIRSPVTAPSPTQEIITQTSMPACFSAKVLVKVAGESSQELQSIASIGHSLGISRPLSKQSMKPVSAYTPVTSSRVKKIISPPPHFSTPISPNVKEVQKEVREESSPSISSFNSLKKRNLI